ncbi:MAG: hypothetical protein D5R96_07155 [Methanocalculus sp. MSAO_Arc2]|nr:MAG: hypothetical protein D5R96_07155 [Methanocalculus sp. MSAO_Arc2]
MVTPVSEDVPLHRVRAGHFISMTIGIVQVHPDMVLPFIMQKTGCTGEIWFISWDILSRLKLL